MVWIEHMPGELCSQCLTGEQNWFALPPPEPWPVPRWKTALVLGPAVLLPTMGLGWLVWRATGDAAIWLVMTIVNVAFVAGFVWRSRQGRRLAMQSNSELVQ